MTKTNEGGKLPKNIAHFARVLRQAGLPVGPAAVIDAIGAVEAAGLGPRSDLYWVLHAVFVKKHEQSLVFDQAFRAFWRRRGLIEKMIAEMSPVAPPPDEEKAKPKPGAARVAEALSPREKPPIEERPETEFSARLTMSDREVLAAKDFAQMSADEIGRAKRVIASLKLPEDTRLTRRFRPANHGRIDPRASFRRSLRAGGASIDLAFRAPALQRPPIVALVDISGSMAEYSRLFLHFLHAVGETRRRVHSFVFATRLTNISRELTRRDPDEALARAAARVQDWEGGTRIAGCLHDFNRNWSRRVLGQGAIVLLFTDGLERQVDDDLAFEMDRLKRSCRRLVWLNPLLRFSAFEPRAAGIRAMLPHVHDFRPIHSLGAMEDLVRAIGDTDPRRQNAQDWLRASA